MYNSGISAILSVVVGSF